jgi:hypothetical protein
MMNHVAVMTSLLLFWGDPALAQSAKAEIDRASFFAEQAQKQSEEALFYFRNKRTSYACTFLGSALSYTNRAIGALKDARNLTSDATLLRRTESDLQARRGNRTAILEAGKVCPRGLADYDSD